MLDNNLVCKMYKDNKSMRQIALELNTNHKLISRILNGKGIKTREPLKQRGKTKFKCNNERLYNNMATHLRFDVNYEWLMQFKDFDKLKLLNDAITNRSGRWDVSTEWYKFYLIKFYEDNQFNDLYKKWVDSDFQKYKKPSLDHIISKWNKRFA